MTLALLWLAGGVASWLIRRRHSYGVGLSYLPGALVWGPVPLLLAAAMHGAAWATDGHYRAWCRERRRGR